MRNNPIHIPTVKKIFENFYNIIIKFIYEYIFFRMVLYRIGRI